MGGKIAKAPRAVTGTAMCPVGAWMFLIPSPLAGEARVGGNPADRPMSPLGVTRHSDRSPAQAVIAPAQKPLRSSALLRSAFATGRYARFLLRSALAPHPDLPRKGGGD